MTSFMQRLAMTGRARLFETTLFVAAGSTAQETIAPSRPDYIAVVYALEMSPSDLSITCQFQGLNVAEASTIYNFGHPVDLVIIASPAAPVTANVTNASTAGAVASIRYIEIADWIYRDLARAPSAGMEPGWPAGALKTNGQPSNTGQIERRLR